MKEYTNTFYSTNNKAEEGEVEAKFGKDRMIMRNRKVPECLCDEAKE
jgi:hypothetical protein